MCYKEVNNETAPHDLVHVKFMRHYDFSPISLMYFDVLLTVHLSIILVINQLNAQIFVL